MKSVTSTIFAALACIAALSACSATIGPYVTDIQQNPNGDLVVYRCSTEISRAGNMDHYETKDCTQKVLPYPRVAGSASAGAPVATPPPPGVNASSTLLGP